MDFLKSAVASAIAKSPPFPYTFGDRVDIDQSIWTLHNGTKREDGSACSIFSFDITANRSRLPLAKNALRRLRMLRHPGIVKVLDTVETDTYIYIAIERVSPLSWQTKRKAMSATSIVWGLHTLAKTLSFINTEASSVHGNVRLSSIFITESGEWKLAGVELLSSMQEDDAIIYSHASLVPDSARYMAPEVEKGGWDSLKRGPVHAIDSYDLAILIYEAFNGSYSAPDQLATAKSVPHTMQGGYKRLLNPSPKIRLSTAHFLEQGKRRGAYFDTPLIHLSEGIENLGLKSEDERETFLKELETVAESDDLPEEFFKIKILPELLKAAEFGGGGPRVMSLIMRIGTKLTEDEFNAKLTPVILRLFTSPDRALRVSLLDNLPGMIDRLSQKTVNDKIFPQIVTGFSDLAPIVREQTVKSVLVIITKLSDRVINGELLRHLAKTANDDQPGIRTNTTICLGKIAKSLGANTRTKVLVAAFTRSLRDPFVHARCAALMALAATVDLYNEEDCAARLLPALCPTLTDKEKIVREQANKALDLYVARVRKYGQTLPDSVLPPPETAATANIPRMATPQTENSWTGWAISSFTNKMAAASGEMQQKPQLLDAGAPRNTIQTASNPSLREAARPRLSTTESAPIVPQKPISTAQSSPGDDFAGDWGAMDDDDSAGAWGDADAFNTAPSSKSATPLASYDDGGEPDFEGWLSAQSAAKKQKAPLPRGLSRVKSDIKPLAQRPAPKSTTASSVAAVKKLPPKPTPVIVEPEEDEDWDDAWGT